MINLPKTQLNSSCCFAQEPTRPTPPQPPGPVSMEESPRKPQRSAFCPHLAQLSRLMLGTRGISFPGPGFLPTPLVACCPSPAKDPRPSPFTPSAWPGPGLFPRTHYLGHLGRAAALGVIGRLGLSPSSSVLQASVSLTFTLDLSKPKLVIFSADPFLPLSLHPPRTSRSLESLSHPASHTSTNPSAQPSEIHSEATRAVAPPRAAPPFTWAIPVAASQSLCSHFCPFQASLDSAACVTPFKSKT